MRYFFLLRRTRLTAERFPRRPSHAPLKTTQRPWRPPVEATGEPHEGRNERHPHERGVHDHGKRHADAETGALIGEPIENGNGSLEWAADSQTLLYVWLDEEHRPRRIFAHRLGSDGADTLIHEQPDPAFFLGLGATQSRRFLTVSVHDHETAEVRLVDASAPLSSPRLVAARKPEHDYSVEHQGEELIILTNSDRAEDYRIVAAPVESPGPDLWREIEPHRPGRLILDVVAFKHHLVRLEREDGLPRIVIRRLADGEEHAIAFPEEAYALGLSAGFEYDTTTLRFTYSSMTTPAQVFDYDMESRERVLRKTQEVPSGHDPSLYVTRRIMAPAKDGETVPVSLLYRKTTPLDGTAPLLLYGYGAYGMSIPAGFSTNALSLVDRGFVYALAHIRGGKDKGYRWYKDGKREKKVNSFTDFIAAGEHLANEGFTSRGRIVAQGGSAGGMLMGAVANMAPDLFLGIIAEVPFVDVLTTMLDATLAADAAGMAGMGKSDRGRSGLSDHRRLFALRQCARGELSAHSCARRADRPARDLLGTGEMGGASPRDENRRASAALAHQYGGWARRRLRPLRAAEGSCPCLCVCVEDC